MPGTGTTRSSPTRGGNFLLRTVYGPGENEPLYQLDNQGRRTWFSHDERGSTIAGADASGAAAGQQGYDDYGEGNSSAYPHGFTGALRLRTTGLYYMRARIYDPKLGRFLQPDPFGYGDGMNMYAYTGGDPVNAIDPKGTLRDIYIGGGNDTNSRIVASYAERQMALHPGRDIQYFIWSDTGGIADAIRTTPANEPLNIIGHSLGGAAAIRAADRTNRTVDTLITIDPVDMPFYTIKDVSLNNVKVWANVTANPPTSDSSDWVAWVGGKVNRSVTSRAHYKADSRRHHGQFLKMMEDINADRAIARTYEKNDGD
jgi:RHS repeat-associated protein